jgi:hypothetical protein
MILQLERNAAKEILKFFDAVGAHIMLTWNDTELNFYSGETAFAARVHIDRACLKDMLEWQESITFEARPMLRFLQKTSSEEFTISKGKEDDVVTLSFLSDDEVFEMELNLLDVNKDVFYPPDLNTWTVGRFSWTSFRKHIQLLMEFKLEEVELSLWMDARTATMEFSTKAMNTIKKTTYTLVGKNPYNQQGKVRGVFSLLQLSHFCKMDASADTIDIGLRDVMPMRIIATLSDALTIDYCLAPKVDDV